jgi:hypothetical protein
MKKSILSLVLCCLVACSHHREKAQLQQTLVNMQCEEALRKDPFRDFTDASVDMTEHLGKKALAYSGRYKLSPILSPPAPSTIALPIRKNSRCRITV